MTLTASLSSPETLPRLNGETGRTGTVTHELLLDDGRRLCIAEYGPRQWRPIVYLHGFLGSRLEPLAAGPLDAAILAVDRPGYGRSDPCAEPSLRRFGRDLQQALDRLAIDRVNLIGVSAGAPYAVAACAVLGGRVERCVLAAGVAGSAAFAAGGGAVSLLRRARRHLKFLRRVLPVASKVAHRLSLDRVLFDLAFVAGENFAPDVDRRAVERGLVASTREGTRRGLAGAFADIDLLTRPWDVDPTRLDVPVSVLHGADDPIVPAGHAAWYGAAIPGAGVRIVPGTGHASLLVNHVAMILRELGADQPAGPARPMVAARPCEVAARTRRRV